MNALQVLHRFVQHLAVEVVSYSFHMAMLAHPQQITGTADLKVTHRDLDSGTQLREFPDRLKTFFRVLL